MNSIYKQALDLKSKTLSYLDMPNEQLSNSLKQEIEKLLDGFELKKDSRHLESLTKNVESLVRKMNDDLMDYGHRDDLIDRCQDIIQDLRRA
jgi:hypothetical protein